MVAIRRFHVHPGSPRSSIYFTITGARNIVHYTEDFIRGVLNRGSVGIYLKPKKGTPLGQSLLV